MIELTQEQIHALAQPEGQPPRMVNPQTQEQYVLVPVEEYSRLVHDEGEWTEEERDLLRAKACDMLDSFGKKP